MPFSKLDKAWSNLAGYYNTVTKDGVFAGQGNVTYTPKPTYPLFRYSSFDDGLIRGGVLNVGLSVIRDTVRIGKFFASEKGFLFVTKQVGLQKSNPRLEQPQNFKTLSNNNTQLYNLGVNTLAQIPVNAFGRHIIRHGILPVGGVGFLDNDSLNVKGYSYEKVALTNDKEGKNRLVGYLDKIRKVTPGDTTPLKLQEYNGGASSVYGLGKTQIFTTNLKTDKPYRSTLSYKGISTYFDNYRTITNSGFITNQQSEAARLGIVSSLNSFAISTIPNSDVDPFTGEVIDLTGTNAPLINALNNSSAEAARKAYALQKEIDELSNRIADNDFSIHNHLLYKTKNIQSRIGTSTSKYGPNNIKTDYKVDSINIINITDSKTFYDNAEGKSPKLTSDAIPAYKDKVNGIYGKDIVKFRIEFLNNEKSNVAGTINTDVLAFRAYIDDFQDGMAAKWNPYRYMGRGEDFYVYDGFTRDVSVAFTLFAHSPEEMAPIYRKLNYLMSSFAPDYSEYNKMRGNIGYLTVGDYLYRQPGVFTDIKLSGMLDSHWEINLDNDQYELPKYIKVNMSFKPIHTFLPRRQREGITPSFITPDKEAYKNYTGNEGNKYLDIKTQ